MKVGDFLNNNFITCSGTETMGQLFEKITSSKISYVLVMAESGIDKVLSTLDLFKEKPLAKDFVLKSIQGSLNFAVLPENDEINALTNLEQDIVIAVDKRQKPVGFIDNIHVFVKLLKLKNESQRQLELNYIELRNIIHYLDVDIFVTDAKGYILFLNPYAEKVCGFKQEDVIGKHVTDLERENLISSSITMGVIKTGKKTNIIQKMNTGKTVLSSAMPIFNEQGELIRVLSTSNNVVEINELLNKIERQNRELAVKDQQLDLMREALFNQNNFACFSKGLNEIKETVIKIAPTDLTVLIQGESGVGKEVAAKLVHSLSPRNKYTFIKINCGLIPYNLIESELFGYDSGAFTGANKNGKIGKIELADNGTLFLDEIGEMPLNLQVKLLEFLQDREITRIGGTKRISINTRIVAATNRDLKEMVQQGKFREDLFYRLNVFPIRIAPLRERKEDISIFAEYFLQKFNDKYKLNKKLASGVLDLLIKYDWPGNVREFEHVIERVVVSSSSDLITTADLDIFADFKRESCGKVICTGLIPWKLAKKELEEQLIKRAYDYYKSTYKAAKALEVSQSTVAKIIKDTAK